MKTIELTQGKVAIVDDCDYERLVAMGSWYFHLGYAVRKERLPNGKGHNVRMHRSILDAQDGIHVDHINGDKLDNRRSNLRLCTHVENLRNQRVHRDSRSGIKGANWRRDRRKWQAKIMVDCRTIHLGYYSNPADASAAYDAAAIEHFGEFARLNNLDPYDWDMNQFMRLVFATSQKSS